MNATAQSPANAGTMDGHSAVQAKAKKRTRSQSLPDRILKFKHALDASAPLVADDPDLAQELGRIRDKALNRYVELERQRGKAT